MTGKFSFAVSAHISIGYFYIEVRGAVCVQRKVASLPRRVNRKSRESIEDCKINFVRQAEVSSSCMEVLAEG